MRDHIHKKLYVEYILRHQNFLFELFLFTLFNVMKKIT